MSVEIYLRHFYLTIMPVLLRLTRLTEKFRYSVSFTTFSVAPPLTNNGHNATSSHANAGNQLLKQASACRNIRDGTLYSQGHTSLYFFFRDGISHCV